MKIHHGHKDCFSHTIIHMSSNEESLAKQIYEKMKIDFIENKPVKQSKPRNTLSTDSSIFSTVIPRHKKYSNLTTNPNENNILHSNFQNNDLKSASEIAYNRSINSTSKLSWYTLVNTNTVTKPNQNDSVISEESLNYFASSKPIEPIIKNQNSNILTEITSATNVALFKTVNTSNYSPSNKPSVLPKCIINRIIKSMYLELYNKNNQKNASPFNKLVKQYTSDDTILSLNWNEAVETGKIMIAEIVELILTANIENDCQEIKVILELIRDTQTELLKTCRYLYSNIDANKTIDKINLNLLIMIIKFEIRALNEYVPMWFNSKRDIDLNDFFIKKFNDTLLYRDITEAPKSSESCKDFKSTSYTQPSTESKVINPNSEVTNKSDVISPNKSIDTIDKFIPGNSVITSSRLKKCMKIIKIEAKKLNLTDKIPSQDLREKYIPLSITNNDINSTSVTDQSLLKFLINRQFLWEKPIKLGQENIADLLEFIINTTAQDSLISKDLYHTIVIELENLKHQLLQEIIDKIQKSRKSNSSLDSFCYELLTDIIIEECTIANYLFTSLDAENPQFNSMMLGKLYKNFILQYHENSKIKSLENNDPKPINDIKNQTMSKQMYSNGLVTPMDSPELNHSLEQLDSRGLIKPTKFSEPDYIPKHMDISTSVTPSNSPVLDPVPNQMHLNASVTPTNSPVLDHTPKQSDSNNLIKPIKFSEPDPIFKQMDLNTPDNPRNSPNLGHTLNQIDGSVKPVTNQSSNDANNEISNNLLEEILKKLNHQNEEINKLKTTIYIIKDIVQNKLTQIQIKNEPNLLSKSGSKKQNNSINTSQIQETMSLSTQPKIDHVTYLQRHNIDGKEANLKVNQTIIKSFIPLPNKANEKSPNSGKN